MATSKMLAMIEEEILKQSSNLLRICISLLYGANTYKDYEIAHLLQKLLKSPSPSSKGSKSLFFGRLRLREGGDNCRIYVLTFETFDTILKKTVYSSVGEELATGMYQQEVELTYSLG